MSVTFSEKIVASFFSASAIRKMFEEGQKLKAQYGANQVADLSLGNPFFPPPAAFTQALHEVAQHPGPHAYMSNAGYQTLRSRIAENLRSKGYFPDIQAEHLVMTTGAAGAINIVLKTILNPGDEVIVLAPYFVEYRFYIDNHGGRMVLVDTDGDMDLDLENIEAALSPKTRAILINSPNNPSGRIYARSKLQALAALLSRHSQKIGQTVFLISDEPYREIIFGKTPFTSAASLYPNSFMCYSWSKAFNISGERMGYVAVNPAMEITEWSILMGSLAMCNRILGFVNAPAFMQHVLEKCLDAPVDIGHYAAKREKLCAALDQAGYHYPNPEGTFYLFPQTLGPEAEFIQRAKEKLLLVVPGSDFGQPDHFRISYAAPEATVDLACSKLKALATS